MYFRRSNAFSPIPYPKSFTSTTTILINLHDLALDPFSLSDKLWITACCPSFLNLSSDPFPNPIMISAYLNCPNYQTLFSPLFRIPEVMPVPKTTWTPC